MSDGWETTRYGSGDLEREGRELAVVGRVAEGVIADIPMHKLVYQYSRTEGPLLL